MMKLAIAVAAAALAATPAFAEDYDFILVNGSGKPIKTVEVAPTGTTTWQPNKIDPDFKKEGDFKAGGRMTVHFDKADKVCKYDVKATFSDDSSATWKGVNVCDTPSITVKLNAAGVATFAAN